MRLSLFFMAAALLLTLVTAQGVYQLDKEADVRVICDFNGFCSATATCNVTIVYPNNTIMVNNQLMTNNNAYHNYTVTASQHDVTGVYDVFGECTDTGVSQVFNFEYEVTGIGYNLDTSDSVLYIVYLAGFIFVFLLSLYGAVAIPLNNKMNEAGELVGINFMKYIKIACVMNLYIMLLFFAGTMNSIFEFFLLYDNVSAYFGWMYAIMFAGIYPVLIMSVFIIFMLMLNDKKNIQELKDLERMVTG